MELHLGNETRAAILSALKERGYNVVEHEIPHSRPNFPTKYENVGDAETILDAAIVAGYGNAPFSGTYTPLFLLKVQLVDAKTGKACYNDMYQYKFAADPRYSFHGRDELVKNPELAMEGLRAAIPAFVAELSRVWRYIGSDQPRDRLNK